MVMRIPEEKEVLSYFDSLSNWGRWGDDDQKGTLNLIDKNKTLESIKIPTRGKTVSCSRTIVGGEVAPDIPNPPVHFMLESGEGWESGKKITSRKTQGAIDYIGMIFHGYSVSHIDSPAHFFWEGKMFNGIPSHYVSTNLGATAGSVELVREGLITRGVLIDVPMLRNIDWLERGTGVMPEDILEAEKQCGFTIEPGDVLLVRTGQYHRRKIEGPANPLEAGSTACHAASLPLFREKDIAMLGSDTGNDIQPPPYPSLPQPIHQIGIVGMGLWILDNANLEELARTCREYNQWHFMFVLSPLMIKGGTGSPANPLALF